MPWFVLRQWNGEGCYAPCECRFEKSCAMKGHEKGMRSGEALRML